MNQATRRQFLHRAAAFTLLSLAGCGGGSASIGTPSSTPPAKPADQAAAPPDWQQHWDKLVAAAKQEGVVAYALAVGLLLAVLGLIAIQQKLVAGRQCVTVGGRFQNTRVRLGLWTWPLFGLVGLTVLLMIGVPLVFSIMGTFMRLFGFFTEDTWTLKHWAAAIHQPALLNALKNTVLIGFASALLGVAAYVGLTYLIVRARVAASRTLDVVSWLPTAIPGIVLSLAFASVALNVRPIRPLYGTPAVLILAFVVATMPLGVQILNGAFKQLAAELEEAS